LTLYNFPCASRIQLTEGTDFYQIPGGMVSADAQEVDRTMLVPADGVISNFKLVLDTAPGAGNTRTFDIRKNGSTGLVVVISNTETTGNSGASTLTVSAGDLLSLRTTETGTPLDSVWRYSFDFESDNDNFFPIFGGSQDQSISNNQFMVFGSTDSSWNNSNDIRETPLVVAGTIKNLRVALSSAPGSGRSRTFEVYKNQIATGLTVTVADTSTTGFNGVTNVAFAIGDKLSIQNQNFNNPGDTEAFFGVVLETTVPGSAVSTVQTNSIDASSDEFFGLHGSNTSPQVSLSIIESLVGDSITLNSFYAEVVNTLTGTGVITLDIMVNGVAQGLNLVINNSNQSRTDTSTTITLVDGDEIAWRVSPSNNPDPNPLMLSVGWNPSAAAVTFIPRTMSY